MAKPSARTAAEAGTGGAGGSKCSGSWWPDRRSRLVRSLGLFAVALGLFSLARFALWVRYPQVFASLSVPDTASAFAYGLRFDAAVVGRVFALPLLLANLPLRQLDRHPTLFRVAGWLLFVLAAGLTTLLIADVLYYEHVGRHIAYELAALDKDWRFLLTLFHGSYVPWIGGYLLLMAVAFLLWHRILAGTLARPRRPLLAFLALFLTLAVVGRGNLGGKVVEIIDAYPNGEAAYGNLALNGAFTALVFALNLDRPRHHFFDPETALAQLRHLREVPDARYPMLRRLETVPTRRNVVFVLLESWNFQHVDSFGHHGYRATPVFDALAGEGRRHTRFYAAGQRSIEGIQATLTGVPALRGLPRLDTGIGISNITRIGSIARKHGYRSIFVQTSARDSFKVQGIAAALGFDEFYGREDLPLRRPYPDGVHPPFGWDYEAYMLLKERLDRFEGPYLAYLFTGTTHMPYPDLPEFRLREHDPMGEGGYINALRYADWSLGEFMKGARGAPWFANTIFIFTADHVNRYQSGGFTERFHIPFLIYAPGLVEPGEDATVGSQLDVLPTLMDLLGFSDPFAALGESLLDKRHPIAFVTEGSNVGLIADCGYVRHNLARRLEAKAFRQGLPSGACDTLERQLLTLDQVSYDLLRRNAWMPSGLGQPSLPPSERRGMPAS